MGKAAVRARVRRLLADRLGRVSSTRSGEFVVEYGAVHVYVSVDNGRDAVLVTVRSFACWEVPGDPALFRYIATRAGEIAFASLAAFERADDKYNVHLHHTLLGSSLDPDELLNAIAAVGTMSGQIGDEVLQRFGGRRAVASPPNAEPVIRESATGDGALDAEQPGIVEHTKARVHRLLCDWVQTVDEDADGHFLVDLGSTTTLISVEPSLGAHAAVTVTAVSNRGLSPSPELYRYMATGAGERPQFAVPSVVERADGDCNVVVSYAFLGDTLDPDELVNAVSCVADATNRLRPDIEARFGGAR